MTKKIQAWHGAALLVVVFAVSQGENLRKGVEDNSRIAAAADIQGQKNLSYTVQDKLAREGSSNALNRRVMAGALPVQQVLPNALAIDLEGKQIRDGLFVMDSQGSTAEVRGGVMVLPLKIQLADMKLFKEQYAKSVQVYYATDNSPVPLAQP